MQPNPLLPRRQRGAPGRALGLAGFPPWPFLFRPRPLQRRPGAGAGTELGQRRPECGRYWQLRDMTAGRQAEGAGTDHASARLPSRVAKLLSALFYGTCSFLLVLVNKALLTTYR